jgi:predicted XRE-type DNA-binding protein
MTDTTHIKFEEGSGNIFADLGMEDAEERLVRAQLGFHVVTLLKNRDLKQKDAAVLLDISQPDVSHLLNGHFSRFTTDKLLDFLKRLEQKVKIEISPHHAGEPYQSVAFGVSLTDRKPEMLGM